MQRRLPKIIGQRCTDRRLPRMLSTRYNLGVSAVQVLARGCSSLQIREESPGFAGQDAG